MKTKNTLVLASLTVLAALCLQACVPAALVAAGAAATGLIVYDSRSVATMSTDSDITYRAQAKVTSNQELADKTHISATSFNQVLLVVGQAPTEQLRDLAMSLMQKIPKVKHIYNEIAIAQPINMHQRSNDAWLTTKVKTALLEQKNLRSAQIKVLTEDSVVYMLGSVTHGQGDLAADAAKQVAGVRKVVKAFEYVS
ncbi:MAG: BON domain-containing protein [Gammaproteobacteria bacterium]